MSVESRGSNKAGWETEISLQPLAEARGVDLKRHGADLLGHCPFHEDRTPSRVITPAKNLWHCLGACQAGGTVIDWVMRAEGISFPFRHACVPASPAKTPVDGCRIVHSLRPRGSRGSWMLRLHTRCPRWALP